MRTGGPALLGLQLIPAELGLDADERRDVLAKSWRRWAVGPVRLVLTALALVAVMAIELYVFMLLMRALGPMPGAVRAILSLLMPLGMVLFIELAVVRIGLAPNVYAELRARGHDVCGRCGYLMEGLAPSTRACPECGPGIEGAGRVDDQPR